MKMRGLGYLYTRVCNERGVSLVEENVSLADIHLVEYGNTIYVFILFFKLISHCFFLYRINSSLGTTCTEIIVALVDDLLINCRIYTVVYIIYHSTHQ